MASDLGGDVLNDDLSRIVDLLNEVPRAPGKRLPSGLMEETIAGFEERTGLTLPPEHREVLRRSNGPCVGPGGIFGIQPATSFLDIEQLYDSWPEWRERRWVPIAGDGNGNFYVAVPVLGEWPVVFIETTDDPLQPAFVVASGVLKAIRALLEKELRNGGWPFAEEAVLAADPKLAKFAQAFPLPWRG